MCPLIVNVFSASEEKVLGIILEPPLCRTQLTYLAYKWDIYIYCQFGDYYATKPTCYQKKKTGRGVYNHNFYPPTHPLSIRFCASILSHMDDPPDLGESKVLGT